MMEFTHEFAEHLYHAPKALEKHSGVVPIRIGYNRAKPNYHIGPRFIAYFSLHFVLEGQVTLRIGREETTLRQGDLFVLFPHKTHEYFITPGGALSLRMFWIAAEGRQMPQIVGRLGVTPDHPFLRSFFDRDFEQSLFRFAEEWKRLDDRDDLSMLHCLYGLLNQLLKLAQPGKPASPRPDDWVAASLDYIRLHYREGISVRDIAEHAGIHRSHFSTVFLEKTGVRPHRYLMNLIMKDAMQMVSATGTPIAQIALSLGYADSYSFTVAFKKYYGRPPSFYRKQREK